jgi:hypothetical protein
MLINQLRLVSNFYILHLSFRVNIFQNYSNFTKKIEKHIHFVHILFTDRYIYVLTANFDFSNTYTYTYIKKYMYMYMCVPNAGLICTNSVFVVN